MNWSIKLGRILGIEVFVHFTFVLMLGLIGVMHWAAGGSLAAALSGVVLFLCIFVCVLLHEYGHALAARRFGVGTRDITLYPIGGVARLERMPEQPLQELWVALAGPAVNVGIALLLVGWLALTGTWQPSATLGLAEGSLVEQLLAINVFLVLFNMLPAFPMDGGRVLRALLAMRLDYARATAIAAMIGKGMAVVFAVLGFFGNPMLLFIALFVWMGAGQEESAARFKAGLTGAMAREAMVTNFRMVSADATLDELAQIILQDAQQDFPVVESGRIVGMLGHEDILNALHERDMHTPVSAIMRADFATVEEGELLEDILAQSRHERLMAMPVMRRGRLTGLLTPENLQEYYVIREARKTRRLPPPLPRAQDILFTFTTRKTHSHS